MKITNAFIIRLVKMPDTERNLFLHNNRNEIDFPHLTERLKETADQFIETGEQEMAEKILDIKADISLYEALQRFPAAIDNVEMLTNPVPENKVLMEMSSMQ